MGIPKNVAKDVSKVMADAIVIAVAIVLTAGAAAPEAATEETADEGIEMTNLSGDDTEPVAEDQAPQNTRSRFMRKIDSALQKLPRKARFALIAAFQAAAATNIGTDIMTLSLTDVKNKQEAKMIASIVGMVITIMASLASGVAGYSVCSAPQGEFQATGLGKALKALSKTSLIQGLWLGELAGGLLQSGSSAASSVMTIKAAIAQYKEDISQAAITILQA